jgi:hypothetical protein
MDFTNITAAVDATTVVAALGAVAAVKILPNVARWGYSKVVNWFRG